MKHLLDGLQDELTDDEQQLVSTLTAGTADAIQKALVVRTGFKAKSIELGLYLSETSLDVLTQAVICSYLFDD